MMYPRSTFNMLIHDKNNEYEVGNSTPVILENRAIICHIPNRIFSLSIGDLRDERMIVWTRPPTLDFPPPPGSAFTFVSTFASVTSAPAKEHFRVFPLVVVALSGRGCFPAMFGCPKPSLTPRTRHGDRAHDGSGSSGSGGVEGNPLH